MHALLAMPHVVVGRARRVVPLIVLARPRQARPSPHGCRRATVGGDAGRAAPRTARSSARPSGTHRAAPARTRRRPASRNRGRPPRRPSGARARAPAQADRAPHSTGGTSADPPRSRSPHASRWCGHSRAGRARRHGNPASASAGMTLRQEYASSGKPCSSSTQGRSPASNPASSTCTRSPLTSGTKRERTPAGSTALSSGARSVIVPSPMLRRGRTPPRCVRDAP